MAKPLVLLRLLPGRAWLLVLLALLAVYGGILLGEEEQAVETMTGAGEAAPPQGLFDTVCNLWGE